MAAHFQYTGQVNGTPMQISTWSWNFKMGFVSTVPEVASDGTISSAETTKFVNSMEYVATLLANELVDIDIDDAMILWNTRLMDPNTVKTWCDHPILPEVAPALPQVAPALPPVAAAPIAAWHGEMAMDMHLSEVAAEQAEKASQSLQEQNALVVAIESPEQEDDPHEQGLPVEAESSPTKRLKKSSTCSVGGHL